MRINPIYPAVFCLALLIANAAATVFYVDVNSANPTPPYTNWNIAAANIQQAVDVSTNGDFILVTNGIYQTGGRVAGWMTNRLAVTKAVTVQSINGPTVTIIRGYQVPGTTNGTLAVRCVFLTNNAVLVGFTLTNGATHSFNAAGDAPDTVGGGVFCNSSNAIVSNCIITGNSAADGGGGADNGIINNSLIIGNSCFDGGGAATGAYVTTLNNCLVVSNSASNSGGGAFGCNMNNCLIAGNTGGLLGGGGVNVHY